jgi:L-aminopeptidase/D-esterase-like protein
VEALGRAFADLVARAIVRGVRAATAVAGLPAARDLA